MNAWNWSTLSHSSTTRTNPSPIPNRWCSPPTPLDSSEIFANSSARSSRDRRNLSVSPWNFAMISTLMLTPPWHPAPLGAGFWPGYVTATAAGSPAGQVSGQLGQELLGLVQVGAVARVLDDRLAVLAAGYRVAGEHGAGLRQHGLRRPGLLARPAGDRAEGAQVGQVVQGRVGDDHVVGAADPEHRRLGLHAGQAGDAEVGGSHRVEHAAVAGGEAGPGVHRAGRARVVVVTRAGGQHRLHEDVQVLGDVRRLDVVREQYLAR